MTLRHAVSNGAQQHYSSDSLLNTIHSQFIMSITDTHGVIVEVNKAFCEISQYSEDELIGQQHSIINSGTHPRSFFSEMWKTLSNGESWRGEVCNRAKDGSLYWVDSTISPLCNDAGEIDRYISIRTNITQRKQDEDRLKHNQVLLERMGETANVGGWQFDFQGNQIFWTKEICRLFGSQPKSLFHAIEYFAPECQDTLKKAVNHCIQTGEGWDLELPFIQATGEKIWVRTVGSVDFVNNIPARAHGVIQDITAQVLQQQALEEAHKRYMIATTSGNIGIWEYNLATGTVTWDEVMYQLYGLLPSDEKEAYELWSRHQYREDKRSAEQAIEDALRDLQDFDTEFRIVWRDGTIRDIHGAAQVMRDNTGKATKMVGVNWDVTTLNRLNQQVADQRELLAVTLESISDAVITTDVNGDTVWLNPVAERMTGWTTIEAKGRPLDSIFELRDEEANTFIASPVQRCLEQNEVIVQPEHVRLLSRDQSTSFGIESSAAPIRNEQGNLFGAVLTFRDVTEQRHLHKEINYRASHDALTGLINRDEFDTRINHLLSEVSNSNKQAAMLFVDLDQFKIVNDTCGHSAGDDLLKRASRLLEQNLRQGDTLARLGGDEFGIILEDCSLNNARDIANNICQTFENYRFIYDQHKFRVSCSIGVAPINDQVSSVNTLMQAADTSMYAAKDLGRNRVHTWSDDDSALIKSHGDMRWTHVIENALDENNFRLFVQRIEDVNKQANGLRLEVLLRMVDEDGSLIPPSAFLPVAERYNLASRIDHWVLTQATLWLKQNHENIEMLSVNLSGQSVSDTSFHNFATELLSELEKHVCAKLCLEITETAAITNLEDANLFIKKMNALSVLIALDDFGAGASSFSYIKNLPVDVLKIDGQFIKDLINDPLDDAAVRCFVDVANILELKTVAEFVETPDILERVKELGIDFAQGFLMHKPEPIEQALLN